MKEEGSRKRNREEKVSRLYKEEKKRYFIFLHFFSERFS